MKRIFIVTEKPTYGGQSSEYPGCRYLDPKISPTSDINTHLIYHADYEVIRNIKAGDMLICREMREYRWYVEQVNGENV